MKCSYCDKPITKPILPRHAHHENHFCNKTCRNRFNDRKRWRLETGQDGEGYGEVRFALIDGPEDVEDLVEHGLTVMKKELQIGIRENIFPPGCKFRRAGKVYEVGQNRLLQEVTTLCVTG